MNFTHFQKALKVHLKLKTINFELLSRTKTLKQYTNNASMIYNGAKELLDNELNDMNDDKYKYRLLGVRVSELRDCKKQQQQQRIKTIDTFMKSSSSNHQELLNNDLNDYCLFKCPICDHLIESNKEFVDHHIDLCTLSSYDKNK